MAYPTDLITEAKHFQAQMQRVIKTGQATDWRGAHEVIIANEVAPPIPASEREEYIASRPQLAQQVLSLSGPIAARRKSVIEQDRLTIARRQYGGPAELNSAYGLPTPALDSLLIQDPETIAAMEAHLDAGPPISISGFQRQGKTTLAFALGAARNTKVVYADAQDAYIADSNERPMQRGVFRIPSNDGSLSPNHYRAANPSPKGLWAELNDDAQENDERILVCLDELPVFMDHQDKLPALREEIAEIVSLSNLDLVVTEHIVDGLPLGEHIDLLPENTRRFFVPPANEQDVYSFLRSKTADYRQYFLPEAASLICKLAGGRLSMAATIGGEVMHHAINSSDKVRSIFDATDVREWEESYVRDTQQNGISLTRLRPLLWHGLSSPILSLNSGQQIQLERIVQQPSGVDADTIPADQLKQMIDYNLVDLDASSDKVRLTSGLMAAIWPSIMNQRELLKRKAQLDRR